MGNKYGMNTTEANAGLAARNLEHWRQEVGKLHSQVDRLKHDRDIGAKDYCALMERHDAAVGEIARLTQINADLTAANAALMVRVEALPEERKFYHAEWSIGRLLAARTDGMLTDKGEAWRYSHTGMDGEGGKYDLLYRRQSSAARERSQGGE